MGHECRLRIHRAHLSVLTASPSSIPPKRYISLNWQSSGGGAFAILPLPSPFTPLPTGFPSKLPDIVPLARSHTAPVLDTDWSPFNDSIVASAGEDGKAMIWKVESSTFDGWGLEHWEPQDFDPVARIDVSPRRVGHVLFHPTANNVLATSTGDHVVKLWDLAATDAPKAVLGGHGDAIQSLAFNPAGTLLATTCRDRKIRIFDPRAGSEAVRMCEGHGGIKVRARASLRLCSRARACRRLARLMRRLYVGRACHLDGRSRPHRDDRLQ